MIRFHTHATAIAAAATIALTLADPSAARADSARLDATIRALDADDFARRQAASAALANDPEITEEALVGLLEAGTLSPEQRTRVRSILRERFMASTRGAIGISFAPDSETEIRMVHEGFPTGEAGLLEPGDVIVAVEGRSILGGGGRNLLLLETCSREPGEILRLRVRRQDDQGRVREIDVEAPLGDVNAFAPNVVRNSAGQIFPEHIRRMAFDLRMSRLGLDEADPTMGANVERGLWGAQPSHERARTRGPSTLRWSRVLAGPVDTDRVFTESVERRLLAGDRVRLMLQDELRNVRQLDEAQQRALARRAAVARVQINRGDAENVRIEIEDGRAVEIRADIARQEVRRQFLEDQARGRRLAMLKQAQQDEMAEQTSRHVSKPLEAANRLARRIGTLEADVAEQERLLRTLDDANAGVRTRAQERIADLRVRLAQLELELLNALELAEQQSGGIDAEASAGDP